MRASTRALKVRLGVSGRSDGVVGAMLIGSLDLAPQDASWRYAPNDALVYTGTRRVGGLSVVFVVTLGFDVRSGPTR